MELEFTPDETINKLTLLYVLDQMEIPLTESSILDICTSRNSWLNYMECLLIMNDLIKVGFIYKDTNDDEPKYGNTNEGRDCLSYFYARVPQSLREQINQFAREKRMEFKRRQEYVSEYAKNSDGSYTVTLRIKEPSLSAPLLELKMRAPTRSSATLTCKKWNEQAPNVFEYLYDTLISD